MKYGKLSCVIPVTTVAVIIALVILSASSAVPAYSDTLMLGPGQFQDPGGQTSFDNQTQYWSTVTLAGKDRTGKGHATQEWLSAENG